MKILVIYHDDHDGWACGFLIRKAIENDRFYIAYPEVSWENVEQIDYVLADYHNKDEILKILKGNKYPYVIMCDFAYQPIKDMLEIIDKNKSIKKFIWIDHHISNIKEYEQVKKEYENNPKFEIILKDGIGACWLVLERFFKDKIVSGAKYWTLEAIAKYDVWKYFDKEKQLSLIFYMNNKKNEFRNPNSDEWTKIMNIPDDYEKLDQSKILKEGYLLYKFWLNEKIDLIRNCSFDIYFEDFKTMVICGKGINSLPFEEFDRQRRYDLYMTFYYCGGIWTVSLYSTKKKVDCSKIAKKYGGGGHKGAAGFQCSTDKLKEILNIN